MTEDEIGRAIFNATASTAMRSVAGMPLPEGFTIGDAILAVGAELVPVLERIASSLERLEQLERES